MSVCPRRFEAEALRDGRLTGAEVARFRSHVTLCPACEREVRELEALAVALRGPERADTPRVDTDELQVRRRRTRLLAAFDANLVPAPRQGFGKVVLALAVALGTFGAVVGLALAVRDRSGTNVAPTRTAAVALDPVAVRADSGARWSRRVEHQLERIDLESGTLAIRVEHTRSPRRVLVLLPDGELEDIGTAFTVSAEAGRTTRVHVQEGSVILRLRGQAPRILRVGDAWTPDSAPPASVSAAVLNASSPRSAGPRVMPSARLRPKAAPGAPAAPPSSSPSSAELDLRAAERAEDAAYLRVIALQRAGDVAATQRAARDYLSRYPRGFRRAEVERLAQ